MSRATRSLLLASLAVLLSINAAQAARNMVLASGVGQLPDPSELATGSSDTAANEDSTSASTLSRTSGPSSALSKGTSGGGLIKGIGGLVVDQLTQVKDDVKATLTDEFNKQFGIIDTPTPPPNNNASDSDFGETPDGDFPCQFAIPANSPNASMPGDMRVILTKDEIDEDMTLQAIAQAQGSQYFVETCIFYAYEFITACVERSSGPGDKNDYELGVWAFYKCIDNIDRYALLVTLTD